jgi:5-methylcytosine-specific restriction endonuclease McrA
MTTSTRARILKDLGFASYRAYLRSPLWRGIRILVFRTKGRRCCLCGSRAQQIHHRRYDRSTLLGAVLTWLEPICVKCHTLIERTPRGRKREARSVERLFKVLRKKAGP